MVLITRCPACTTAFRVGEEQLRLRQGWVRCGVCNDVFDARADLNEKAQEDLVKPAPATPSTLEAGSADPVKALSPESVPLTSLSVPLLYDDEPGLAPARPVNVERLELSQTPIVSVARQGSKARTEPSFDAARFPRTPEPVLVEPSVPAADETGAPSTVWLDVESGRQEPHWGPDPISVPQMRLAEPMPARVSFFNESGHDAPVLNIDPVVPQAAQRHAKADPLLDTLDTEATSLGPILPTSQPLRWPWALGVIVGVCLLVLQFAYVFRAHIAAYAPETRPYLQQLCDVMKCEVGHLTDAALLSIESSSIEPWQAGVNLSSSRSLMHAGGEPPTEVEFDVQRRLALRVVLRNRAPFEQPWPAMELSLTDSQENVVARRVLPPELYHASPPAQDKMGAGTVHELRVPIDTSAPRASGYRVLFFYP